MKNKLVKYILVIILFCTMAGQVSVWGSTDTSVTDTVNSIITYQQKQAAATSSQEFVDNGLVPYAGVSPTEWMVIDLVQHNVQADYSGYVEAAKNYAATFKYMKATDYERIAMAFSCLNVEKEWIEKVINEQTGSFGIMSYIYGLMLINSRDYDCEITGEDTARALIEQQNEDGGWSLSGQYSDADVTAMALQALAIYYPVYSTQIDKAVQCLSVMQKASAGYASMGVENVESSAQVLMALCALHIDYRTDTRFIKNGTNLLDAIMEYSCGDGGFAHTMGGTGNGMATSQVLQAMVCLEYYENNGIFIYNFGKKMENIKVEPVEPPSEAASTIAAETETTEEIESAVVTSETSNINGKTIKLIILAVVIIFAVILIAVMIVRHRWSPVRAIIIVAAAASLCCYFGLSDIKTRAEHYSDAKDEGEYITYISIKGYDGMILDKCQVRIDEGESVFEQLYETAARYELNLDYTGNEMLGNIYIRGIDGLNEFDYGSMSGWTYCVNTQFPQTSAAACRLNSGDYVEWIYTEGEVKQ